jgi:Na+/H+ antiporter NhaC
MRPPLRGTSRRSLLVGTCVTLGLVLYFRSNAPAFAQSEEPVTTSAVSGSDDSPSSETGLPTSNPVAIPTVAATSMPAGAFGPGQRYGLWVLVPALAAILVALIARQVIIALILGILVASGMMCYHVGIVNPLSYVIFAVDHYLIGVLAYMNDAGTAIDTGHLKIIIFTLFIGAMIGVMETSGGTRAMVQKLARTIRTRRKGQIGSLGAGMLIFFDDYASAMILGPGLRPVFDRLRISREKLAYIINTCAVAVASLFIGTWLAMQISFIDGGFQGLKGTVPAFLQGINANTTFWACIPYRTYTLLCLVMVLWIGLTGRDFGPMKKSERAALAGRKSVVEAAADEDTSRWALAFFPTLLLVLLTIYLMNYTGYQAMRAEGMSLELGSVWEIRDSIGELLKRSDSHFAMLYASMCAALLAILLSVASRALSVRSAMDAAVRGMAHMFAACIILVLAWGLARASNQLELGAVTRDFLQKKVHDGTFAASWIPLCAFLAACLISFSIGTSWGTMTLLCPPVIQISAGLFADMPPDQALQMFYAAVGGVMAGAVFGNNCSPLSDTTVLSSIFCDCDLESHVRTQLPYGITVVIASIAGTEGAGRLLAAYAPAFHANYWNVWAGLGTGALLLLLIVLLFGRRPPGLVSEPAIEVGV